jgi:predicted metal-binding membrane protein
MHRSAGAVRSSAIVAGFASRNRTVAAACIVLITALAWVYLFRIDSEMSPGAESMAKMGMAIDADWSARDFFLTFIMWSVMMVGMMTASAAPTLLLFSGMSSSRGDPRAGTMSVLFGAGHLSIWIAFSLLAAVMQDMLHRAASLSADMSVISSSIAGVILIGAGLYQLSPAKNACLKRCQSPLGFLLTNWRDGNRGALELGLRHGMYCLGCCWALMLVLFVVGVMNLVWVAALTAFILVEKFGRAGTWIARLGGLVMIGTGAYSLGAGP